jgi:hypothetical protein
LIDLSITFASESRHGNCENGQPFKNFSGLAPGKHRTIHETACPRDRIDDRRNLGMFVCATVIDKETYLA